MKLGAPLNVSRGGGGGMDAHRFLCSPKNYRGNQLLHFEERSYAAIIVEILVGN